MREGHLTSKVAVHYEDVKCCFRIKELTRYPSSSSIPASTHVPEHVLKLVCWVGEAGEVLALAQCLRLPMLLEPIVDVIS